MARGHTVIRDLETFTGSNSENVILLAGNAAVIPVSIGGADQVAARSVVCQEDSIVSECINNDWSDVIAPAPVCAGNWVKA